MKKHIKRLEQSEEFKDWHKENPNSYLAHVFTMLSEEGNLTEVGYYNEDGTITTFSMGNDIVVNHHKQIFQKDKHEVRKLQKDRIKVSLEESLKIAEELQKKEYPAETPMKKFVVLQTLENGQMYNITYVTPSFKTLNIKVCCEKGEIIDHNLVELIQFPGNAA